MTNPLDEIEVFAPLNQGDGKLSGASLKRAKNNLAVNRGSDKKRGPKKSKPQSLPPVEDIFIDAQNIVEDKKYSKEEKNKTISAEEIFASESGTFTLVVHPQAPKLRQIKANKCVLLWSWVSVPTALIPFVIVDVAATIAIQIKMIKDLCALYDIPFKNENARAFISGLIGGGVASIASSGLKTVLLKSLPHVGSTIAFLAQPALGFSTTYALGQVFIRHVENDGVLTNFDSEKMQEVFREQLEKGKSLFKRGRQNIDTVNR